ncbi:hypothetical protein BH23GEM3_BH23GEM3_22840 [soil metagenome]|nr:response regulator [Gemmatimonadota bacterium]
MSTILFADDELAMRQMVAKVLETGGHAVRLAKNGTEAIEQLRASAPDLVLLDYQMGEPTGLEVCWHVKNNARFGHLPVLILTGHSGMEARLQGFEAGADDYLAKPFEPRELLARVAALLRLANRGLERNPTSGLPGGNAIQEEFRRWREQGEPFSICYLDLDDFKPFGDRFGFSVADAAIRAVGDTLREISDDTATFAGHIGGDDFILLCRQEDARRMSEEAQARFHARIARYVPPEVVRTGRYTSESRDGAAQEFAVTRLSAAIVRIHPSTDSPLVEIGESVARAKRQAKRSGGGGIVEMEVHT